MLSFDDWPSVKVTQMVPTYFSNGHENLLLSQTIRPIRTKFGMRYQGNYGFIKLCCPSGSAFVKRLGVNEPQNPALSRKNPTEPQSFAVICHLYVIVSYNL